MEAFRKGLIIVLVVLLILFVLVFSLNNQEPLALDFLFHETRELGAGIWLMISFVLGGILGILATSVVVWRQKSAKRRLAKKLKKSEKALQRERQGTPKRLE